MRTCPPRYYFYSLITTYYKKWSYVAAPCITIETHFSFYILLTVILTLCSTIMRKNNHINWSTLHKTIFVSIIYVHIYNCINNIRIFTAYESSGFDARTQEGINNDRFCSKFMAFDAFQTNKTETVSRQLMPKYSLNFQLK